MEVQWTEDTKNRLESVLTCLNTLLFVKEIMGVQKSAYRYDGIRKVYVTLANGRKVQVSSAVFILQRPKRVGRPPKQQRQVVFHPALELLGFINKKSPGYLSNVARAAVSSASFQAAASELSYRGIKVSAEQVRKMTYQHADLFMKQRIENVLDGSEKQAGLILEISADGGRIRMKEEVIKKNKKRKKGSFKGQWREPILFTIRVLNSKGELVREVPQLMDATMGNWESAFKLMEKYLRHYNLKEARQVTFIADGSKLIWPHVEPMMKRLKVKSYETVIDHMHAKQNMNEVIALIHKNQSFKFEKEVSEQQIHEMLWNGDIDGIKKYVIDFFGKKRRDKKAALKKLDGYFAVHSRFAYAKLKKAGHPIGSGSVESAIRRVINLKMKNNGTFWLEDNCERMLYLRCQFLTGRWETLHQKLEVRRVNLYNCKELEPEVKVS